MDYLMFWTLPESHISLILSHESFKLNHAFYECKVESSSLWFITVGQTHIQLKLYEAGQLCTRLEPDVRLIFDFNVYSWRERNGSFHSRAQGDKQKRLPSFFPAN